MGIYFEIQADQTDRAKRFYTDVFAWKFTKAQGTPVEYWRIETSEGRGGLLRRPAPAPPAHSGTNAYVCSLESSSFEQVVDAIIKHRGGSALRTFGVRGVCWQGYFLDREGNTFG